VLIRWWQLRILSNLHINESTNLQISKQQINVQRLSFSGSVPGSPSGIISWAGNVYGKSPQYVFCGWAHRFDYRFSIVGVVPLYFTNQSQAYTLSGIC
jgi:hypothetical protein